MSDGEVKTMYAQLMVLEERELGYSKGWGAMRLTLRRNESEKTVYTVYLQKGLGKWIRG